MLVCLERYRTLCRPAMRVVYDGATGTNIGVRRPSLDDFLDKEGCNELLVLSRRYILPSHDPFDCFAGRAYAFAAPHASFVASVRHSVIWRCASPKARRSLATRSMREGVAYHGFVLLPSIKLAGPVMTFGSR